MRHDDLIERALASGALTSSAGNAAEALRSLANRDAAAANAFAAQARTDRERVMLGLAFHAPGLSYEQARQAAAKFGTKDPDAALVRLYGS